MIGERGPHGKQIKADTADGRNLIGSSRLAACGGALLVVRDLTEQRQTERDLSAQREAAKQANKLSAFSELLAGEKHEFNNPFSIVFGYSQMIQGKSNDPILVERVELICQSAERVGKIVKIVQAMARQRPTRISDFPSTKSPRLRRKCPTITLGPMVLR